MSTDIWLFIFLFHPELILFGKSGIFGSIAQKAANQAWDIYITISPIIAAIGIIIIIFISIFS